MPYLNNDGDSRLNNFPTEPKMYVAESTSIDGNRNYLVIGVVGLVLTISSILIAMAVS
ncbi:photosystem II assembly protein Psb34 [Chamaesiphon sp. OTE_75_metabat_556]|uniref:photosystem II assembly protein Psb34 n=1 Tax=Chamaesiphon sp. OTE_75_metabat_556 TaxID=2964692 RepID=UPI00286B1333|nr:ssl1498 family light-harvesting-like protein [Chamaesiphon sp. OTE_75_metabat_556]